MKVLISGSTGFVGKSLAAALTGKGFEVVSAGRADFAEGVDALAVKVSQVDVVVNLAGAPIVARWSASYKKEILDSRIKTTKMLADAIVLATKKPGLFISTSAVGIYPDGEVFTEANARYGHDFLAKVCTDWEAEAMKAASHTRVAIFRLGVVLSAKGGALPKLLLPFKLGLGGPIAGGKQGFSWIHMDDLINAYLFVIEKQLGGVFNLSAPEISDNAGFTRALGSALKRPAILPVPAFALRLVYGEGASALTNGQKVISERLQKEGFVFRFPDLETALMDLLK
jgi:uncharacterized protein